jgi:hypothetical protein
MGVVNGALDSSRALSVSVNSTGQPLRIGGNTIWSDWTKAFSQLTLLE